MTSSLKAATSCAAARTLAAVLTAALATASCSSGGGARPQDEPRPTEPPAPAPTKGPDMSQTPANASSVEDRLAKWAGPDLGVNPYHLVQVPGMQLFYLANTVVYRGVAVLDGAADPLTGAAALAAARGKGITDPWQLGALALHFLVKGGAPLRDGNEAQGQPPAIASKVTAPRLAGDTLELWARDERGDSLLRYQFDLAAGTFTVQSGAQLAAAGADPVEQAQKALAMPSDTMYPGAIDALVALCADPKHQPKARAALVEALRKHPSTAAREHAAFAAAGCKHETIITALIAALEGDKQASVRKHAADSLGKLGATAAKAALERAAKDADPNVSGAAGRALKKVGG